MLPILANTNSTTTNIYIISNRVLLVIVPVLLLIIRVLLIIIRVLLVNSLLVYGPGALPRNGLLVAHGFPNRQSWLINPKRVPKIILEIMFFIICRTNRFSIKTPLKTRFQGFQRVSSERAWHVRAMGAFSMRFDDGFETWPKSRNLGSWYERYERWA